MRRVVLLSLSVVFIAVLASAVLQQSPKVDVPVLPTERDQFGGRPGAFHFVTNEQAMADAAQLQQAFAALDRLEQSRALTGSAAQADLKTLRGFLLAVHAQQTATAGETAKVVEQHLNAAKGKFMCGACHGHGMMRGRGGMPGR